MAVTLDSANSDFHPSDIPDRSQIRFGGGGEKKKEGGKKIRAMPRSEKMKTQTFSL